MITEDNNRKQQDKELREMNYSPGEDIFNEEKKVRLDKNGIPLEDEEELDDMEMDLDVPGSEEDNEQEDLGSEDEENNYYSLEDNEDNHEEENEDLEN